MAAFPHDRPSRLLIVAASLAACVYLAYSVPPAVQELASFCSEKLSATETRFWAGFFTAASRGAAIGIYVCSHGPQDFKIFSIALATHCVFIFTFTNGRRLLKRLIRFVQADPNMPVVICFLLVPITVIASLPQLHWIFWLRWYYESYRLGCLPSMRAINWHLLCFSSYLSSTALTHFVEITTIISITVIYASVAWVDSLFLFVLGFPSIFRTLLESLSYRHNLRYFLCFSLGATAFLCIEATMWVPISRYMALLPWARQVTRQALYCQESRRKTKEIFWYSLGKYRAWKAEQIVDFWGLAAATPNTLCTKLKSCFEIWYDLHPSHKLLIAGPALVFYGYLYLLPLVRLRFRRLVARWRNR